MPGPDLAEELARFEKTRARFLRIDYAQACAVTGLVELRCYRCSQFLGETQGPVALVGITMLEEIKNLVPNPRWSWKCKCGWTNIYRQASP